MTDYGTYEYVDVHFDDLDAMGIVHNGKYVVLVERALSEYWAPRGWPFDPRAEHFEDIFFVVKEFSIRYLLPIASLGPVVVHLWIERLGTSSVVYGFRVLSVDRSVVHAEGRRVQVKLDRTTLRPSPLSDAVRKAAERLLGPEPSEHRAA